MKRPYLKTSLLTLIIMILIVSQVCWALSPPKLYHPIDNSIVGSSDPYFDWKAPRDALSCIITIFDIGDDTVIHKKEVFQNNYRMPTNILKNNTTYRWEVVAKKSSNEMSIPSENQQFTTTNCYGIPNWPDRDCDGIIDDIEKKIIFTDPDKKTLFVKPLKIESGKKKYWEEFVGYFTNKHGIFSIPQFADAGIEIVVIGNSANDYEAFQEWDYDPAKPDSKFLEKVAKLDPPLPHDLLAAFNNLPCDIMEIILAGENEFGTSWVCPGAGSNEGHINFISIGKSIVNNEIKNVSVWTFDTLAFAFNQERPHRYFSPEIYSLPFKKYFFQGPYPELIDNSEPEVLNCKLSNTGCKQLSPMNLYDDDPSPNPPFTVKNIVHSKDKDTVEFAPYVFNKEGVIVYAPPEIIFDKTVIGIEVDENSKIAKVKPYTYEDVLRRIIVHEMGHALLRIDNSLHCGNLKCIMCRYPLNWEKLFFGTRRCQPNEKEYASLCCEHDKGGSQDIRADGVVNNFVKKPKTQQ